MFWRLLLKIGIDILESLIIEFVLVAIRAFFVNCSKAQRASFA